MNTSLTRINLSSNGIGDEGGKAIGEAIFTAQIKRHV